MRKKIKIAYLLAHFFKNYVVRIFSFFSGPINLVLIAVCAVSIGYSIWTEIKQRRTVDKPDKTTKPGKRVAALGAMIVSTAVFAYIWMAGDGEAYAFPRLIGIMMLALATVLFVEAVRTWGRKKLGSSLVEWSDIWPGLAMLAVYLLCLNYLGFYLSSLLLFVGITGVYSLSLDQKALIRIGAVALIFVAIIYALFNKALLVTTPGLW